MVSKSVKFGRAMDTDQLLEPLAAYQNSFAHEFSQHAEEMFAKLLKNSGIDAEENRATVKKYDAEMKKAAETEKSIRKFKTGRTAVNNNAQTLSMRFSPR